MVGYHDGRFADAIDGDRFFRIGDLGYADEDGYLVITGRVKNVVNRGRENIPVAAVEKALVSDEPVDDAVVVGIPGPVPRRASGRLLCRSGPDSLRPWPIWVAPSNPQVFHRSITRRPSFSWR